MDGDESRTGVLVWEQITDLLIPAGKPGFPNTGVRGPGLDERLNYPKYRSLKGGREDIRNDL